MPATGVAWIARVSALSCAEVALLLASAGPLKASTASTAVAASRAIAAGLVRRIRRRILILSRLGSVYVRAARSSELSHARAGAARRSRRDPRDRRRREP